MKKISKDNLRKIKSSQRNQTIIKVFAALIAIILAVLLICLFVIGASKTVYGAVNFSPVITYEDYLASHSSENKKIVSITEIMEMNKVTINDQGDAVFTADPTYNDHTISISTAVELFYFSQIANGITRVDENTIVCEEEKNYYLSKNYILSNHIDFSRMSLADSTKFIPIGSKENPFVGSFDGRGFEIRDLSFSTNLNYIKTTDLNDIKYCSLFAYTGTAATISNIGIVNPSIVASSRGGIYSLYVAPLCGENNGTISNSYITSELGFVFRRVILNGIEVEEEVIDNVGDCTIFVSGLVYKNNGSISSGYVDSKVSLCNNRQPIVVDNTAGSLDGFYYVSTKNGGTVVFDESGITIANGTSVVRENLIQKNDNSNNSILNDNWYIVDYAGATSSMFKGNTPKLYGLDGSGTTADPFLIKKPIDLVFFSEAIENDAYFRDKNYHLSNCIDMSEVSEYAYVTPSTTNLFTGSFDGANYNSVNSCDSLHVDSDGNDYSNGNHSIINFRIASSSEENCFGMFVTGSGARITNLNFIGGYVAILPYVVGGAPDSGISLSETNRDMIYYASICVAYAKGNLTMTNVHTSAGVFVDSSNVEVMNEDGARANDRYSVLGGSVYVGGLVAFADSGEHHFSKMSFNGEIDLGEHYSFTNTNRNISAVGGVFGYITSNTLSSSIDNILSGSITSAGATSYVKGFASLGNYGVMGFNQLYVGGIAGVLNGTGFVLGSVDGSLENNSDVYSHSGNFDSHMNVSVGGVIGRGANATQLTTATVSSINLNIYNFGNIYANGLVQDYVLRVGGVIGGSQSTTAVYSGLYNGDSTLSSSATKYNRGNIALGDSLSNTSYICGVSSGGLQLYNSNSIAFGEGNNPNALTYENIELTGTLYIATLGGGGTTFGHVNSLTISISLGTNCSGTVNVSGVTIGRASNCQNNASIDVVNNGGVGATVIINGISEGNALASSCQSTISTNQSGTNVVEVRGICGGEASEGTNFNGTVIADNVSGFRFFGLSGGGASSSTFTGSLNLIKSQGTMNRGEIIIAGIAKGSTSSSSGDSLISGVQNNSTNISINSSGNAFYCTDFVLSGIAYKGIVSNAYNNFGNLSIEGSIDASNDIYISGIGYNISASNVVNDGQIDFGSIFEPSTGAGTAHIAGITNIVADYIINAANTANVSWVNTSTSFVKKVNISGICNIMRNTATMDNVVNSGIITYNTNVLNETDINSANDNYIGGIIGNLQNNDAITNVVNLNNINMNFNGIAASGDMNVYVGGIAGKSGSNGTITYAVNGGNISASNSNNVNVVTGGIIGSFNATGSVNSSINFGNISGANVGGGIVALGESVHSLDNVINHGNVSASEVAGGIVGRLDSASGKIYVAINYGTLTSVIQGGIIGSILTSGYASFDYCSDFSAHAFVGEIQNASTYLSGINLSDTNAKVSSTQGSGADPFNAITVYTVDDMYLTNPLKIDSVDLTKNIFVIATDQHRTALINGSTVSDGTKAYVMFTKADRFLEKYLVYNMNLSGIAPSVSGASNWATVSKDNLSGLTTNPSSPKNVTNRLNQFNQVDMSASALPVVSVSAATGGNLLKDVRETTDGIPYYVNVIGKTMTFYCIRSMSGNLTINLSGSTFTDGGGTSVSFAFPFDANNEEEQNASFAYGITTSGLSTTWTIVVCYVSNENYFGVSNQTAVGSSDFAGVYNSNPTFILDSTFSNVTKQREELYNDNKIVENNGQKLTITRKVDPSLGWEYNSVVQNDDFLWFGLDAYGLAPGSSNPSLSNFEMHKYCSIDNLDGGSKQWYLVDSARTGSQLYLGNGTESLSGSTWSNLYSSTQYIETLHYSGQRTVASNSPGIDAATGFNFDKKTVQSQAYIYVLFNNNANGFVWCKSDLGPGTYRVTGSFDGSTDIIELFFEVGVNVDEETVIIEGSINNILLASGSVMDIEEINTDRDDINVIPTYFGDLPDFASLLQGGVVNFQNMFNNILDTYPNACVLRDEGTSFANGIKIEVFEIGGTTENGTQFSGRKKYKITYVLTNKGVTKEQFLVINEPELDARLDRIESSMTNKVTGTTDIETYISRTLKRSFLIDNFGREYSSILYNIRYRDIVYRNAKTSDFSYVFTDTQNVYDGSHVMNGFGFADGYFNSTMTLDEILETKTTIRAIPCVQVDAYNVGYNILTGETTGGTQQITWNLKRLDTNGITLEITPSRNTYANYLTLDELPTSVAIWCNTTSTGHLSHSANLRYVDWDSTTNRLSYPYYINSDTTDGVRCNTFKISVALSDDIETMYTLPISINDYRAKIYKKEFITVNGVRTAVWTLVSWWEENDGVWTQQGSGMDIYDLVDRNNTLYRIAAEDSATILTTYDGISYVTDFTSDSIYTDYEFEITGATPVKTFHVNFEAGDSINADNIADKNADGLINLDDIGDIIAIFKTKNVTSSLITRWTTIGREKAENGIEKTYVTVKHIPAYYIVDTILPKGYYFKVQQLNNTTGQYDDVVVDADGNYVLSNTTDEVEEVISIKIVIECDLTDPPWGLDDNWTN